MGMSRVLCFCILLWLTSSDLFLVAEGGGDAADHAAAPTTLRTSHAENVKATGNEGRSLDAAAAPPPPYRRGCSAITRCRCCSGAVARTKQIIRKFLI